MANVNTRKEIDPLVSALNLIMQRQAAQLGSRFGRNRYFFDDQKESLGPRLLAHMGFYSSVRPVHRQLMVNVNACTAAFHEPGKLSEALRAFDVRSFGAIPQNFMANVKVSMRYRGYKVVKRIHRISDSSAKKLKFHCEEYGTEITIEDFFRKSTFHVCLKLVVYPDPGLKSTTSNFGKRIPCLSSTLEVIKDLFMSQQNSVP